MVVPKGGVLDAVKATCLAFSSAYFLPGKACQRPGPRSLAPAAARAARTRLRGLLTNNGRALTSRARRQVEPAPLWGCSGCPRPSPEPSRPALTGPVLRLPSDDDEDQLILGAAHQQRLVAAAAALLATFPASGFSHRVPKGFDWRTHVKDMTEAEFKLR